MQEAARLGKVQGELDGGEELLRAHVQEVQATASGISSSLAPAERREVAAMSARAQKKWDQLDVDGSDRLDGDEVLALGEEKKFFGLF